MKTRLKNCLTKEIHQELINGDCNGEFSAPLKSFTPWQYIMAIQQTIIRVTREYCESHNINQLAKRGCLSCESLFHQVKNCKMNNINYTNKNRYINNEVNKNENLRLESDK